MILTAFRIMSSWQQQPPPPSQGRADAVPSSSRTRSTNDANSNSNRNRDQIASLLDYAHSNYETNPTDSLTALLEALRLNAPSTAEGQAAASAALSQVRSSLGDDIATHVLDVDARRQRAVEVVRKLLADESSLLYQSGREDLLRQTMEDGSSVVCGRCGGVVSSDRWRQHRTYWCEANENEEGE